MYSFSAMFQKITIPIPPFFAGSDSSFFSISMQKSPSVWARINFASTGWSNFLRCLRMPGTVRILYVTLRLKPPTNAQYAACGSYAAILLRTSSLLIHSITFSFIQVSLNSFAPTASPRYLCPSLVILILARNILFVRCDAYGLSRCFF